MNSYQASLQKQHDDDHLSWIGSSSQLIPSQVFLQQQTLTQKSEPSPAYGPEAHTKFRQIHRAQWSLKAQQFPDQPETTSPRPKAQEKPRGKRLLGTRPNLMWRAVSMEDLREHPNYRALPLPEQVYATKPSEYSHFRQDSWQWDYLHAGRLTTSRVASCLGFYESGSAKVLGVPRSLTKPGSTMRAWMHVLSGSSDISHSELNRDFTSYERKSKIQRRRKVWTQHTRQNSTMAQNFLYQYRPERDHNEDSSLCYPGMNANSARMVWGSTQEATAILVAVNYFGKFGATVAEIGLCPFEGPYPSQEDMESHYPGISQLNLPPMGASPDGLIFWPNGAVEVLEVKNHSPFRDAFIPNKRSNSPLFELNDRGPFIQLGSWHIAQLQWHMLCTGPHCSGAILISNSATKGSAVLRIRRDDEYISKMLHFLSQTKVFSLRMADGQCMQQPMQDFLFGLDGYQEFLEDTRRIAQNAEVVEELNQSQIQRSSLSTHYFLRS